MNRRQFLKLGAVIGGAEFLGGVCRTGGRPAAAQTGAVPTVDRLVLTTVVDNFYDAFARSAKLDTINVQRTALPHGRPLLAEHGLAYHMESMRGQEKREILLDFGYR